jgi:hypothetical protein
MIPRQEYKFWFQIFGLWLWPENVNMFCVQFICLFYDYIYFCVNREFQIIELLGCAFLNIIDMSKITLESPPC